MSKPGHWWYSIVTKAIKAYPALAQAKGEVQAVSVTASYSGMPRNHESTRATEDSALRQLAPREEADLYAVRLAIEDIGRDQYGGEILGVVNLYHWKGVHNFDTVGYMLNMSGTTAKRRNARFVREVAKNMGYLRRLG